jgi:hypothetical protein
MYFISQKGFTTKIRPNKTEHCRNITKEKTAYATYSEHLLYSGETQTTT